MAMTDERWWYLNRYVTEVFGQEDAAFADLAADAERHGLPNIAVSADIGRFLEILVSMTPGRLVVEVGTLGGYSTMWIARGLHPEGRVITLEVNDTHADFAERHFAAAVIGDRIEVRRGPALDLLPVLAADVGPESVDFAFIDADKREYPDYVEAVKPLVRPGGLVVMDNVLGAGGRWIDDLSHPGAAATDRMNRAFAADPAFTTTALGARAGILVARKND